MAHAHRVHPSRQGSFRQAQYQGPCITRQLQARLTALPRPHPGRLVVASAGTHEPAPPLPTHTSLGPTLVQQADKPAELRAASFLRAISFYKYPEGRSEFAARSHRQMKTDSEFESVTAKIQGRDEAYKDMDVTCFVAVVEDLEGTEATITATSSSNSSTGAMDGALAALRQGLDPLLQLPAGPSGPGRLVVGSLDVNVGHTLPSEELIGRLPQEDARRRRAYLSNVCVAPAARRLGVARRLIQHAEGFLRQQGSVQWLYVHVVHNNAAAVALYRDAMQFQVEQVESEATARALQRPRRMLLAKAL